MRRGRLDEPIYRSPSVSKFASCLEDWEGGEVLREVAMDCLWEQFLVEVVVEGDRLLVRLYNLVRSMALERLETLDDFEED